MDPGSFRGSFSITLEWFAWGGRQREEMGEPGEGGAWGDLVQAEQPPLKGF